DDKVLGGVCSGIANYFGIDPLILRLIFVIAFFGFGSGLLLYIILWIIIPLAKTPSEKLEMKGERVNVSNIEKTVKENLDDFKKKVDSWGNELKTTDTSKIGNFFSSLANDFVRVMKPIFMILLKIAAIFLAIIAGIILIALILSLLGYSGVIAAKFPDFTYDIFNTKQEMVLGSLGFALFLGTPIIALLYYALRVIFDIKYSKKWIGLSFVMAWLVGLGLVAVTSIRAFNNFGIEETLVENVVLPQPSNNTLFLDINKLKGSKDTLFSNMQHGQKRMMHVKVNKDKISKVQLDIEKSENGKLELIKEFTAHGRSEKDARLNASKIHYTFNQKDSQLVFNEAFDLEEGTKWRAQDVKLILKVPVGQTIIMHQGMEHIIYDIDNTTNTYDGKMIGYKWLMTERGLTCVDCPEELLDDDPHNDENIRGNRDWDSKVNSYKSNYRTTLLIL
ncbi:MAG: PspC domain-containing protein, partial [Bacteroidia bacterium]